MKQYLVTYELEASHGNFGRTTEIVNIGDGLHGNDPMSLADWFYAKRNSIEKAKLIVLFVIEL